MAKTVIIKRPKIAALMRQQELSAHKINMERAESKLTGLIVDWCNRHGPGHRFHLGEFTRDILSQQLCSPTSPYRIMALLRKKGLVNYKVVSRSQSLYQLTSLSDDTLAEQVSTLDGNIKDDPEVKAFIKGI